MPSDLGNPYIYTYYRRSRCDSTGDFRFRTTGRLITHLSSCATGYVGKRYTCLPACCILILRAWDIWSISQAFSFLDTLPLTLAKLTIMHSNFAAPTTVTPLTLLHLGYWALWCRVGRRRKQRSLYAVCQMLESPTPSAQEWSGIMFKFRGSKHRHMCALPRDLS